MTIQFSTKIFPQADLQSAKHIKSGLKSLLAQSTDCLVLGYSKLDFESFAGNKNAKAYNSFVGEWGENYGANALFIAGRNDET